jgi:ABC-type nickel/cobalt efflux system permease component RcnA
MTALLTLFGIWVVWSSLRRHREETAAAAAVGTSSPSTTSEN